MFKNALHPLLPLVCLLMFVISCKTSIPEPPIAEVIPHEMNIHGHTRVDDYYWLKERDNPKVIEYLEAENAYTGAVLKHTEALQEKLYDEIVGRIKQDDQSVPVLDNGYYYYTRYEEGKEFPLHCRKKGSLDAEEEIMLDVNKMAEGYGYFNVSGLSVSPDNIYLAYGVDTVSRRKYTLYFKNLETGEVLSQSIPLTNGYAVWANDNRTVFYTTKDEVTLRSDRVWKYAIHENPSTRQEVYFEADDTYSVYVGKTKSRKYIGIYSSSTLSDEIRFADADKPDSQFIVFHPREKDLLYSVDHYKDKFLVLTNDNASNFRLMETPTSKTAKSNWKELIPHRSDVLLTGMQVFADYLVLSERENGLTQIRIMPWEGGESHYLDFGEATYSAYAMNVPDFESRLLRFYYTSLTTPGSTFEYDMETREKSLLKQEEILGEFSPDDYESKRLYATAQDGAQVPISLVYRKGLELNGKNPTLLYGYGSYGFSQDARFSSARLSLLDRGFVFAIAHIRGGQEMGRHWYEDGKLLNKRNTFSDFIACAEFLIEENYTKPSLLFAQGGSAGGLLVGAVANMAPELFRGILAGVAFVDVVTTMLDETIPLTTSEYDEWGNPNDPVYYEYMLSYSPYDNVEAKSYPAILATTGLHDSQVQYWEPAKWVAKLRATKTGDNPVLLRTNMEAGHGGAAGRYRRMRDIALEYAFILDLAGVKR
jgi:oligopeptidase B